MDKQGFFFSSLHIKENGTYLSKQTLETDAIFTNVAKKITCENENVKMESSSFITKGEKVLIDAPFLVIIDNIEFLMDRTNDLVKQEAFIHILKSKEYFFFENYVDEIGALYPRRKEDILSELALHKLEENFVNTIYIKMVKNMAVRYLEENNIFLLYRDFSCFNHSCDPNLEVQFEGAVCTLVAKRNIEKGEELTILYRPDRKIGGLLSGKCKCKKCTTNKE